MSENTPNLDAYWMPFTPNRAFKQAPRLLARAEGMYYFTPDGQRLLDGTGGLWCVNAGHGHPRIKQAIVQQLDTLDFCHSFQIGHPTAFAFAEQLTAAFPEPLNRVFFSNSGSEAVDTALKIALACQQARGQGSRTRLVGREKAYHGVGFGGTSVSGLVNNRRAFGPLLPGVDHLPHTLDMERNRFSRGLPKHGAELADDLERLVQLHGDNTIAAVIVEPVSGAGGVLPPPQGYLQRLRDICDRHGILLIFDEVITGFGRLGSLCAAERFGVVPDMITCAKGLTNGTVPMGATLVSDAVHDSLMQGPETLTELFHGYTYSGHPLACATGLACLEVYQSEQLFERARDLEQHWINSAMQLKDSPHVRDIRALGLIAAIDLEPREGAPVTARPTEVFKACFERGILVRNAGANLALSPPLIISEAQISQLFSAIGDALAKIP